MTEYVTSIKSEVKKEAPEEVQSPFFFLPSLFFLLTLSCSCLKSVSPLLPLLAAVGFFLSYAYQFLGVSIYGSVLTLTLLIQGFSLWQGGIFLSLLGCSFLTALLSDEHLTILQRGEELQKELEGKDDELEAEIKNLLAEIERWKEEAEIRRIERAHLDKRLQLLSTEVDQYLKESLKVKEGREALLKELVTLREQLKEKDEDFKNLNKQLQEKEERVRELQADPPIVQVVREENNEKTASNDGLYHQLREQFVEKTKVLGETRSELYKTQTKLFCLEKSSKENELLEPLEIDPYLLALIEENRLLNEEITFLEGFLADKKPE